MCKIKDATIENPFEIITGENKCEFCGQGQATRCGGTMCQVCWFDAEGRPEYDEND